MVEYLDDCLYLTHLAIEQHHQETGRYPGSLTDIYVEPEEGLSYTAHPDGEFTIEYSMDGIVRTYRSSEDPERLISEEFAQTVLGSDF
jgi:hypothetical protein